MAEFNIVPVVAETKTFLNWIERNKDKFADKSSILKTISPNKAIIPDEFATDIISRAAMEEFARAFTEVGVDRDTTRERSLYLLGAAPSWEDIYRGLDAPRKYTGELQKELEDLLDNSGELAILAALGSAGCGKSTIVRRLAINLARNGRSVFLANSESLPRIATLKEAIKTIDQRITLIFDNSEVSLGYIPYLANELKDLENPPIVVIASRTNDFDRICGRFKGDISILERTIPNLDKDEIVSVIEALEKNNLLGVLRGKSRDEQIRLFSEVANKQILVAMREATSGKGFDEIIEDEFNSLVPEETKILYLCTALATEAGYRITKQQFIGCSNASPAETLSILNRNLKDIIVSSGENNEHLLLRHRLIAQYAIESFASRYLLSQAYIRVLKMLSVGLSNKDRNARDARLYRDLINHKYIYERFSNDIDQARKIYESISSTLKNNPHYWLQYGSLEIEGIGGDLAFAENYLNQAESLDPHNEYITNAKGHLMMKKAVLSDTIERGLALKKSGTKILEKNIIYSDYSDSYSVHILCTQSYYFLKKWYFNDDEILREELKKLIQICRKGRAENPRHNRLRILEDNLNQAYFELSLPKTERREIPF